MKKILVLGMFVFLTSCFNGMNEDFDKAYDKTLILMRGGDISSVKLYITKEGRLFGFGGCNRLMGRATIGDHNTINISNIALTNKFCLNDNLEKEFLKLLNKVTHYEFFANMLLLKDNNNRILFYFRMQDSV